MLKHKVSPELEGNHRRRRLGRFACASAQQGNVGSEAGGWERAASNRGGARGGTTRGCLAASEDYLPQIQEWVYSKMVGSA